MHGTAPRTTPERLKSNEWAIDAWERGWRWWVLIYYAVIAVSLGSALADRPWAARHALIVVLAAALAVWLFAVIARGENPRENPRRTLLYFAGALPLWFALVWLDASFFLVLGVLFGQAYGLLPLRWAFGVSAVLTVLMIIRNGRDLSGAALLAIIGFSVGTLLLGGWFAYWIASIIQQSVERRELIEQLEATQRQLAASERQAGSMAERQRLAGEIHDTLAQGFVSVVMHLEAADAALDRQPSADTGALRRHLDDARRVARENLAEARRLVWALRPELLEGTTLAAALGRVVRRWCDETGIAADFTVTGDERQLSPEREVTLLRATQEALANVRKHASATAVVVTLTYLDDTSILDIQDDGRGFDPALFSLLGQSGEGGYGLRGMRERVEVLGGTLSLESTPGEGTTLAIELPTSVGSEQEAVSSRL